MNIRSVFDLTHYYPRTYEKFENITCAADITSGERFALYLRIIKNPSVINLRGKSMLTVYAADSSNTVIEIKYFNAAFLAKALKKDTYHVFRGYVRLIKDRFMMSQPKMYSLEEYEKIEGTIGPVYSLPKDITNSKFMKSVRFCLDNGSYDCEFLKDNELTENSLMQINDAVRNIHFPESENDLILARKRLVFNEFLNFLYSIRSKGNSVQRIPNENPFIEVADLKLFAEKLPYELTGSQKEAINDVIKDMTGPYLMNRLIQGDVGSGKTIVAVMALLLCAANSRQGAMMAPTDVLARQHFNTIKELSDKYGLCIKPVLLVSKMTAKDKKEALKGIGEGDYNVIIGTHALFSDNVEFKDLKLVITDEQHRFGVSQRENLRDKGENTHILVMSATPIPRTLAMIIFANLDISVMTDMPKGRIPIDNCVVDSHFRRKAYEFIKKEIASGRQAYVICPMIDESEADNFNLKSVFDAYDELSNYYGDSVRIEILHGKMKPNEKSEIMENFKAGKFDILVSTTVIEVGIDVPNATVIMIENAERFGLSQLHQLRGRVGRGQYKSYCILVSDSTNEETIKRLKVLNESNDGFEISRQDMKLRGPGELSGLRQSGTLSFALGDVVNDSDILFLADKMYDSVKSRLEGTSIPIIDFRTI